MKLPPFPAEWLELPDDELGRALLDWWIAHQAERKGIPPHEVPDEIAEHIRVATLGMNTDDPRHAALEKALILVASGDAAGGGKLFGYSMRQRAIHLAAVDEAVTGRRKQRAIAKKRRRDGLQVLIEEIVSQKPKITHVELLEALRFQERGDVIDAINDAEGVIEWHDEKDPAGLTQISGLKDRLSRAKKRN